MKRMIYSRFSCSYTYQYFNGNKPSKRPPRTYDHYSDEIHILGEEDKIWTKILKDLGDSLKKRVRLSNKKVTELVDFGYTYGGK